MYSENMCDSKVYRLVTNYMLHTIVLSISGLWRLANRITAFHRCFHGNHQVNSRRVCQKLIKTPITSALLHGDSTRWKYSSQKRHEMGGEKHGDVDRTGLVRAHWSDRRINGKSPPRASIFLLTRSLLSLLQAENCVNASLTHVSQTKRCPDEAVIGQRGCEGKTNVGRNASLSSRH